MQDQPLCLGAHSDLRAASYHVAAQALKEEKIALIITGLSFVLLAPLLLPYQNAR